jgi:hypothetical protein
MLPRGTQRALVICIDSAAKYSTWFHLPAIDQEMAGLCMANQQGKDKSSASDPEDGNCSE